MALPTTQGTNCWTIAEDTLAHELSECVAMQQFLNVGNAQSARNGNMYIDSVGRAPEEFVDDDWKAKFPNVIIGTPGDETAALDLTNQSTGPNFAASGVIELTFSTILANENEPETEQERKFKNSVGDILDEMTERFLDIRNITVEAYGRNPETDHQRMGVILSCLVQVPWGTVEVSE